MKHAHKTKHPCDTKANHPHDTMTHTYTRYDTDIRHNTTSIHTTQAHSTLTHPLHDTTQAHHTLTLIHTKRHIPNDKMTHQCTRHNHTSIYTTRYRHTPQWHINTTARHINMIQQNIHTYDTTLCPRHNDTCIPATRRDIHTLHNDTFIHSTQRRHNVQWHIHTHNMI